MPPLNGRMSPASPSSVRLHAFEPLAVEYAVIVDEAAVVDVARLFDTTTRYEPASSTRPLGEIVVVHDVAPPAVIALTVSARCPSCHAIR